MVEDRARPHASPTAGRYSRPGRAGLLLLVITTTAMTVLVVGLIAATHQPYQWVIELYAVEGLVSVAIGALAMDRRPANRTGVLLCVLGLLTLAAAAGNVGDPVVAAPGIVLGEAEIAALVHLLLAFPSGRLANRATVLLVVIGYVQFIGFPLVEYVFSVGAVSFPGWGVHPDAGLVSGLGRIQHWIRGLLLGAVVVVAAGRPAIGYLRDRRRPANPVVLGYGIFTIVYLLLSADVVAPLLHLSALVLFVTQMAVFFWVPVAFGVTVASPRFGRHGSLEQLGAWLSHGSALGLRDALAATVGDPSLELRYPGDAEAPVGPDRGQVRLGDPDRPLATIVYDRTLIGSPDVVLAAGQLAALAIEREQLTRSLLVSRDAVAESRARVARVADDERRRVAQDLHDLLQSRLVLAAIHAGRLAAESRLDPADADSARQLRAQVLQAVTDVQLLVHGLVPPLLEEQGLSAALEELADRLPVPVALQLAGDDAAVPPVVASTAYAIVAEAFTNVVKHAGEATVTLSTARLGATLRIVVTDDGAGGARPGPGAGLRGIADRVAALNGTCTVDSRPGYGTRIAVMLPCAW